MPGNYQIKTLKGQQLVDMSSNIQSLQELCFTNIWEGHEIIATLSSPGMAGLIIESGKEYISYLIFRTVLDEAEIISLGTKPDFRKMGHARLLLKEMDKILINQKVIKIFLEVSEANEAATNLYSGLDYQKIGIRKDYYRSSDNIYYNAILMQKLL